MDITDFRSAVTVLSFVSFIGIVVWAYSRGKKDDFEAQGQIPLNDDEPNLR